MGYSSWGHKESDMTERLTVSLFFFHLSNYRQKIKPKSRITEKERKYPMNLLSASIDLTQCAAFTQQFRLYSMGARDHHSTRQHKVPIPHFTD